MHSVNVCVFSPPELSGSSVDTAASSVSWHFDNKYYSAEVTFTICHPDSRELLEEDQPWEAIVVLCNINKVPIPS